MPFLPIGNITSRKIYLEANYLQVNGIHNDAMDIYETRRLKLIELIDSQFQGKVSLLADAINKDSSYITRCKYPVGKKGKKRISDELLRAIYENCNVPYGWMDGKHTERSIDLKKLLVPDSGLSDVFNSDMLNGVERLSLEEKRLLNTLINNYLNVNADTKRAFATITSGIRKDIAHTDLANGVRPTETGGQNRESKQKERSSIKQG